MENKKIVVGNMKMNLLAKEINPYIKKIELEKNLDSVILCPSTIYLPYFVGKKFHLGIQNIADQEMGAYTGEVSAKQAQSIQVEYAIVGHSERRIHYGETDDVIAKKIALALASKLKVILCIGETLEERDALKTYKVLKKQIRSALEHVEPKDLERIIIAYEPVWSIGTGRVPSNVEISDTITFIKDAIDKLFQKKLRVLYGGSVTDTNITKLNKIENVDGYLVGGASIQADKFKKIIEVVVTQ